LTVALVLLDAAGVVVGVGTVADGDPAPGLDGVGLGTALPRLLAARAAAGDSDAAVLASALAALLAGRQAAFDHRGRQGLWRLRPLLVRASAPERADATAGPAAPAPSPEPSPPSAPATQASPPVPAGPVATHRPAGPRWVALSVEAPDPARTELDRLQELVVSRTVQLAAASEQAEVAGRARADFLAHTSHEVRTPLNVILSLAHLLQRDTSDPAQRARVQAIELAARQLSALIDDGLDLARTDGRRSALPDSFPHPQPGVPAPPPSADDPALQLRLRHAGRRVLVAEDDDISQLAMLELLTDVGLQVDTADDGMNAVDLVSRRPYALILLDLRMPRLDGLDAARTIRALPGQARTPIIAVTANTFDEDRAACRAAGMDDFLAKPVDVPQLYRVLLRWLDAAAADAGDDVAASVAVPGRDGRAARAGDDRLSPLLGLDGLDAAGGLASVGGRVAVYRRLLAVFAATHQGDGAQLRQLLSQGDTVSASRLAHRLRGSAATLGLIDIEVSAGALERALDGCAPQDPGVPLAAPATLTLLARTLDDALAASLQRLRLALAI
jgi:CheY-like chemotaxis protein/HPt (histidine-containing phosphotransfer) domain-containing protein